jgi:GT2 family glycosyltransferase
VSTLALLVPARNATSHLPRLLDSARAQTAPFDHIAVYDDASTDDTGEVARRYGALVIRADVNTGPSMGKNILAERVPADWVHFHDADDALGPAFVEHAREWIDRDTADVILFATEERGDPSDAVLGRVSWDVDALRRDAVAYTIRQTVTNCGVYRRACFLAAGGFDLDPAVKYNEDQAMHIRLALHGARFDADPYVGVMTYRRAGSMSTGHQIECVRAQIDVLHRAADATGSRYGGDMGPRLWRLAALAGAHADWQYAAKALSVADRVGYSTPHREPKLLQWMARVSPMAAIRAREVFIRVAKPSLRAGLPQVDARHA